MRLSPAEAATSLMNILDDCIPLGYSVDMGGKLAPNVPPGMFGDEAMAISHPMAWPDTTVCQSKVVVDFHSTESSTDAHSHRRTVAA